MNYETVKKLKEAGFPQGGDGMYCGNVGLINPEDVKLGGIVGIAQEDFVYLPTLSELIEACGKDFWSMARVEGRQGFTWVTCRPIGQKLTEYASRGNSPEEAVANLWLALKK